MESKAAKLFVGAPKTHLKLFLFSTGIMPKPHLPEATMIYAVTLN